MRKSDGGEGAASEEPTATTPGNDEDARLARLERIGDLHKKGVLTDDEFAAEKSRVLGSDTSAS